LDIIQQQHESNEEPSSTKASSSLTVHNSPLSKRKDSECSSSSAQSSSPTSSIDYSSCNESTSHSHLQQHNHHKRNGQNLPSAKAAFAANNGNNGYGLDFLAAVIRQTSKLNTCCSFCKNNGESEKIYTSHTMKNSKGKVTCPLLKIYKCPICGQTGDSAHTITYCKKYKLLKRENMLHELKM
jgi:hypothetical protein